MAALFIIVSAFGDIETNDELKSKLQNECFDEEEFRRKIN